MFDQSTVLIKSMVENYMHSTDEIVSILNKHACDGAKRTLQDILALEKLVINEDGFTELCAHSFVFSNEICEKYARLRAKANDGSWNIGEQLTCMPLLNHAFDQYAHFQRHLGHILKGKEVS